MRKSRKIAVFLLVLLAASFAGLEYLNRVVLPAKTRQWAETAASRALERPVSIGRLRVHPWHGFLLEAVAIREGPEAGAPVMLEAERISGGVLFMPILRDREIIIPALHITGPRLRLAQESDGKWNIERLFPKKRAPKPAGGPRFGLLVPRVVVTGGEVTVAPSGGRWPGPLRVSDLDVELGLILPARVECSASASLLPGAAGSSVPPVQVTLKGTYAPQGGALQAAGHAAVPLDALSPYLPGGMLAAGPKLEGALDLDVEVSGKSRGPLRVKAWAETEGFACELNQPFHSGWETDEPPTRIAVRGEVRMKAEGTVPALPAPDPWKSLKGSVTLSGLSIGPVPHAGEIRAITGEIEVDETGARSEKITAVLPAGLPLEASGSVLFDETGAVGFRVKSDFPLEQIPALPRPWEAARQALHAGGRVSAEITGAGSLKPALNLRPAATLAFEGLSLDLQEARGVRAARGTLRWKPGLLTLTGGNGELMERPFKLEGSVLSDGPPEISANLSWGKVSAQTEATLFSDKLEIHSLTGKMGEGTFSALGEVGRPDPVANLLFEATARLEELPGLLPAPPAWLTPDSAKGEISARLLLEGDLRKPAACRMDLKASSPAVTLKGIPLRRLSVDLRQEDGKLALNSAQAQIAGGTLSVAGSLSSGEPEQPWKGRVTAQNVDLGTLARELQWKTQEMSGELQLQWEGSGRGGNPASFSGPGAIHVQGAQIVEIPLLGHFADFLALPSLRKIAFQEAKGPFQISEGRVKTDGLLLSAPQASLAISGWGGFLQGAESPIEWRVLPTLTPELIPEEARSKIGQVIAKGASYLIGEVKVLGTWKKPETHFVSKPLTQILNEQLFNLQDLLKEIF